MLDAIYPIDVSCGSSSSRMSRHYPDSGWPVSSAFRPATAYPASEPLSRTSSAPNLYPTVGADFLCGELVDNGLSYFTDDLVWSSDIWGRYPPAIQAPTPLRAGLDPSTSYSHSDAFDFRFDPAGTSAGASTAVNIGVRRQQQQQQHQPQQHHHHPHHAHHAHHDSVRSLPATTVSAPPSAAPTPLFLLDFADPLFHPGTPVSVSTPIIDSIPVGGTAATTAAAATVGGHAGRASSSKKRQRDDEVSNADASPPAKRRIKSMPTPDLTEEERLLLQLKDDENLPWRDIASRFQTDLGKVHQVPALQMRYKRLREKLRVWSDVDVHALQHAHDYWLKCKWEIIAAKMTELAGIEKWPPKYCARKWEELHPGSEPSANKDATTSSIKAESDQGSPEMPPTQLADESPIPQLSQSL